MNTHTHTHTHTHTLVHQGNRTEEKGFEKRKFSRSEIIDRGSMTEIGNNIY